MRGLMATPAEVPNAVVNNDWGSVAIRAIDVDPRNVVVLALVALLFFAFYILSKFINAKFISKQVEQVITAAGGVQASNLCSIESNEKLAKDLDTKLRAHADMMLADKRETREAIEKLRRELNDRLDQEMLDFKKALGSLAAGNKSTGEAIAKYQEQVSYLRTNFDLIVNTIRKREGTGS